MRALLLTDGGLVLRHDYPTPQPQPGEALIRVSVAGVCATDLALIAGYKGGYRGVLGHEFVGRVVESPSAGEWMGRRVVGEINRGCGRCELCRRGLHKHCRQRRALGIHAWDGAFADYLLMPAANLHVVPETLADEAAVFTEPLAAALQILEQVHITPTSRVVLLGDGRLGLLVAQVLATTSCDLTVVGRNPNKLAIAEQVGASILLAQDDPAINRLANLTNDVVVEVTGSPDGFALARRLVRPGGVIVLKSTFAGNISEFDSSSLVVDEVTVMGSRCGPFEPALRLLTAGDIDVTSLIQARYSLDNAVEALAHAGRKGVLKALISM
jgi:threonine dehydrogenase-like Zn-dependent dehydrogenase